MPEEIVAIFKNFRDRIYRFFPSRRDAAMELVDALSCNRTANSVVELSLSPLHRRNYCSITRVLDEYLSKDVAVAQQQKQELTKLLSSLCPLVQQRRFHLFAVDCTDVFSSYRQRFDIEHFFMFGKNRLLMDKIQTLMFGMKNPGGNWS